VLPDINAESFAATVTLGARHADAREPRVAREAIAAAVRQALERIDSCRAMQAALNAFFAAPR